MRRKRVLVGFGDIRGFTSFTRRAITSPEDKAKVINAVYRELEKMADKGGYHTKFTGDGILVISELPACVCSNFVIAFLRDMQDLAFAVDRAIRSQYPRPAGFRVRVTCGTAFKRFIRGREPEFIDYPVSLADRLLDVHVEEMCVCHESVLGLLPKKVPGIRFEKLKAKDRRQLPGVDQEDLRALYRFRVEAK